MNNVLIKATRIKNDKTELYSRSLCLEICSLHGDTNGRKEKVLDLAKTCDVPLKSSERAVRCV